jgi:hypothetical protein
VNTTLEADSTTIRSLGEVAGLSDLLLGAHMVAVSSVLASDVSAPRFLAIQDTLRASQRAKVPHMIMLDDSSHRDAAWLLRDAGAIVVELDHSTQGGLARPYVIAAQLIDEFVPAAIMVKFEGEKPVFGSELNRDRIADYARNIDILTCERSPSTWESMPPYQVVTELWLGQCIGQVLDVSPDTPSGVIALNQAGRKVFIENTIVNNWAYLFAVPFVGAWTDLRVGSVTVDFSYHPAVVEEETHNPVFDEKRRIQIDVMLEEALRTIGGEAALDPTSHRLVKMLRNHRNALSALAQLD